ncbi:MAG: hypothetical protein ABIO70_17565 [Pseudomonadota bacterium]
MSASTGDFERVAEELVHDGCTASFVVNSAWLLDQIPPPQRDQVLTALARVPARRAARRHTLGDELPVFTIRELFRADDR